jgi:hypothetical protein
MVALGVLLGALCGYCADTARWVGPSDSDGVVSEGTNWDPEGKPTREMLFTGDAGKEHVLSPGDRLTATIAGVQVLDVKVRL